MNDCTLHLNLKRRWFDMIASGEKKEEYREIKPYWVSRLTGLPHDWKKDNKEELLSELKHNDFIYWRHYDFIEFKNGYSKTARTIRAELDYICIGKAKPEWSDNWKGDVFIIKLGKILKRENGNNKQKRT